MAGCTQSAPRGASRFWECRSDGQDRIALVQKQHPHDGGVAVETIFVHESGEMLSAGTLTVPASKQDPQGYGSALTYARRYSLMAACGIAPEDDDGNAASNKSKPPDVAHSGPAIAFSQLSPDWQAWITDLAREVENAFESSGPAAAQELIDNNREQMEAEHVAALWSRLDSKTRSSIKATKRAV